VEGERVWCVFRPAIKRSTAGSCPEFCCTIPQILAPGTSRVSRLAILQVRPGRTADKIRMSERSMRYRLLNIRRMLWLFHEILDHMLFINRNDAALSRITHATHTHGGHEFGGTVECQHLRDVRIR
jgi:hypothetical protein